MGNFRDLLTLARWLGPWADESALPRNVRRTEILEAAACPEGELRMWVYEPTDRDIRGAFLLAPGLHFLGAPHPRFERFASILAATGHIVMSPFVMDYMDMRIRPHSHEVFLAAFDRLLADPRLPPGISPAVFGISFGSWLVFKLACDPERGSRVAAAVIFGGFGSFTNAAEFAVTGKANELVLPNRDLRNTPAVFMNIVDALGVSELAAEQLTDGWMCFMKATWENDAMRDQASCRRVATELASTISDEHRRIFEIGCGVEPGAEAILGPALAQLDFSYLDVRPDFQRMTCPVYLMHGRDDDVIPYTEVDVITAALPQSVHRECFLTGLYGHSSSDTQGTGPGLRAQLREMATMVRMLRVLGSVGKGFQPIPPRSL